MYYSSLQRLCRDQIYASWAVSEKRKNIGAKVLSARLSKVLNLLITLLITCLCNAREHVAVSGEIGHRTTIEITEEVQGNYPIIKQKIAVKKFSDLKSQQKPVVFGKCCLSAARFQMLTTKALNKEITI